MQWRFNGGVDKEALAKEALLLKEDLQDASVEALRARRTKNKVRAGQMCRVVL